METAQVVVALLSTAGLASVLGAVVAGLFNRKKLGADATEIITKAASGVVERIEVDNERLRVRVVQLEERDAMWQRIVQEHTRALQLHAAWDHMAVEELRRAGIVTLPDPPPLYAPSATPGKLEGMLER